MFVVSHIYCHSLYDVFKISNLATKPSSCDYGLVPKLSGFKKNWHELDLYADQSGVLVCPITQGHNFHYIVKNINHDTCYNSSLQCTQYDFHNSINVSNITVPGINLRATWFVNHVSQYG